MFRSYRLRRIHQRFLESCRSLEGGQDYWNKASMFKRWLIQIVIPVPLIGLHEDGKPLLEALNWLERHCKQHTLGESEIREYHRIIFSGRPGDEPGSYRKRNLQMKGHNPLKPPPHHKVPAVMKQLHVNLAEHQERLDGQHRVDPLALLEIAVETHHRIGVIHPFSDGNGRVARLAMNHLLRRYNLGYVIYPPLNKAPELWSAILDAGRGNLDALLGVANKFWYRV